MKNEMMAQKSAVTKYPYIYKKFKVKTTYFVVYLLLDY